MAVLVGVEEFFQIYALTVELVGYIGAEDGGVGVEAGGEGVE